MDRTAACGAELPTALPYKEGIASSDHDIIIKYGETSVAKGEQKGNRESKKPKKEKIKTIAAAPSQKAAGWQPTLGSGKKK